MRQSIIHRGFGALCLLVLSTFLGLSARAQGGNLTPADCRQGCTSKDVKILTAFLVDPATGQPLTSTFACNGTATVKLGLTLTTKTPRVGVTVYGNIKSFVGGVVGSTALATTSECFGIPLDTGGDTVVFQNTFTWTCGMPIVLTNVFLGWGTGNTNFCGGSNLFRCPATPSKCYQMPPGEYIPIIIPTSNDARATECANPAGGSTAEFDLTELIDDVKGSQTDVTVTFYADSNLTQQITDVESYTSADDTIYAKVTSTQSSSAFSKAKVILEVTDSPVKPTVCAIQPSLCGPTSGTIRVLSPSGPGYQFSIDSGATWEGDSL
ncbi:MAG: hypothetical protein EOO11_20480, partial [Chitinophagaceae bacterium]